MFSSVFTKTIFFITTKIDKYITNNIFQEEILKIKIDNKEKYIKIKKYNVSPILTTVLPIVAPLSILVIALVMSFFVGRKKPEKENPDQTKGVSNNTQILSNTTQQTQQQMENEKNNKKLEELYYKQQLNKNNNQSNINLTTTNKQIQK